MAALNNSDAEKLLKDQRVIEEIKRHLWIESEKAGQDIGFEQAKEDWLKKFSKAWIDYNMPQTIAKERKVEPALQVKQSEASLPAATPKRRAKSYI